MNVTTLSVLRAAVGCLGEKHQRGWWQTSFFLASSQVFLTPVFTRTTLLAQCTGVSQAAALVHDERIGVGRVYHLFRLPEDIEQDMTSAWKSQEVTEQIHDFVQTPEKAMAYLRSQASGSMTADLGPIFIGRLEQIQEAHIWRTVAGIYAAAFEQGDQRFPYFADIAV